MKHFLALLITVWHTALVLADDPIPPVPPIPATTKLVGPTNDDNPDTDGSKDSPFVYAIGSKGKLILLTEAAVGKIAWSLDDAPKDTEVLPGDKMLWFPTDTPGIYHIISASLDGASPTITHAWVQIKGPNGPPAPVDTDLALQASIAATIKSGFTGPDAIADCKVYKGAIDGLKKFLDNGQIKTTEQFTSALKAALDAGKWIPGKYPPITKLTSDAIGAGPGVVGHDLSATEVADMSKKLGHISKACDKLIGGK